MSVPPTTEAAFAKRFRLHHVGLAVAEFEPALEFLTGFLGYRAVLGPFDDPIQKVRVLFLTAAAPAVSAESGPASEPAELELVAPLTADSPIRSMLAKSGGGTYHSCFETADLDGALDDARAQGCVVVSMPAPAVAFEGRRIAWIYTPTRLLVELVEAALDS